MLITAPPIPLLVESSYDKLSSRKRIFETFIVYINMQGYPNYLDNSILKETTIVRNICNIADINKLGEILREEEVKDED